MKFEGIAAVVTGGASGLGAATASLLASRGAKVTIIDLNADLGNAKAKEIGGQFISLNVTDDAAADAALAQADERPAHGLDRAQERALARQNHLLGRRAHERTPARPSPTTAAVGCGAAGVVPPTSKKV